MDKSEIRAGVIHELGCKFDDMLESARREEMRHEGSHAALTIASKKVLELSSHVDRDLDSEAFSNIDSPLAIAAIVKKYISRACAVIDSGAIAAENHRLISQGKIRALELVVDNTKKLHNLELTKIEQKKEVILNDDRGHVTGSHPGVSIKDRRNAESRMEASMNSESKVETRLEVAKSDEIQLEVAKSADDETEKPGVELEVAKPAEDKSKVQASDKPLSKAAQRRLKKAQKAKESEKQE